MLAGDERLSLFLYLDSVPFDMILRAFEETNPFGRLLGVSFVDDHCAVLPLDNFCLFDLPLQRVRGKQPSIFEAISQLVNIGASAIGYAA